MLLIKFYDSLFRFVIISCLVMLSVVFLPKAEAEPFTYDPINDPILSATFSGNFAALTAHRTFGGVEVNTLLLLGLNGITLDLSNALFGTTDALVDPAIVDQGLLGTGIVSAPIDSSFFPELAQGSVGLSATFTDTFDGLFAIDFLALTITTASGTTTALMGSDNGFGIGLPLGGMLPSPLPLSIPIDATGTGFDEAISSKSIFVEPIPEPSTPLLLVTGLIGLLGYGWRSRQRAA